MPKADRNTTELPAAEGGHVRFDKWLWAARFYRTRSLAALAIAAGQARHAGERVKVAHPIRVGDTITIRKQGIVWEVVVTALSPRAAGPPQGASCSPSGGSAAAKAASVGAHIRAAGPPQGTNRSPSGGSAAAKAASVGAHIRRGGAAEAATLYRETAASAKTREEEVLRRRAADAVQTRFPGRPTKRQRRKLEDFLNEP